MRPVPPLHWLLLAMLLPAAALPIDALADARVVTGRTPAALAREGRPGPATRWSLDLGAGMAAGGDLFQVIADQTVPWETPRGATFLARRYDVTLDEDVLVGGGVGYAVGPASSLRLLVQWTEMDLTALANDSQYVTPVLWDRASILRGALLWEQRLTATRLQPYLAAGAGWTVLDAGADALDQSSLAPLLGAGLLLRQGERLALRVEVLDGFRQLSSADLVGGLLPQGTDLRERGPQHVVALTAGLRLAF